jgi:hypothetical protein
LQTKQSTPKLGREIGKIGMFRGFRELSELKKNRYIRNFLLNFQNYEIFQKSKEVFKFKANTVIWVY